MLLFIKSRILSFSHAFSGLWHVIIAENNAWIHAIATLCAVSLAFWLKITAVEWALLILTISAVWAAECLNTAIEAIVDLSSPEYHPLAKISKDTSAAAVLVTAITSIIIGLIILGPPLLDVLVQNLALSN
jgi:diacylglycerol kinase (ATP)